MSKSVLISRFGAYGDIIHMSHLPRLLKDQGYDTVHVETNVKGYQLLSLNPFIDRCWSMEPDCFFRDTDVFKRHWSHIATKYDTFINLMYSIENSVMAMENQNSYYCHQSEREANWKGINYYDVTTVAAGFPELIGKYEGELFYSEQEHEVVRKWKEKLSGKFVILVNISGTGPHKRFVQVREVCDRIIEKYSDAAIVLTGSPECESLTWEHPQVRSICGKYPFRQAALMTKYCDCTITCESGLGCAAECFKANVIELMTAAECIAHNKYNPNSLSIQSPCYCSPCYKGPYGYYGCPHKDGNPLCVYFDIDEILKKVDIAYERSKMR